MHTRFVFFSFVALLATAAFVGCGSGKLRTVNVSGTITLDGEAVEGASVSFSPVDSAAGHPAFGSTDAAGRYRLQTPLGEPDAGTTPGRYKVTISKGKMVDAGTGKVMGVGPDGVEVKEQKNVETMPAKTASFKTTDLEAVVENKRENVFNFDLKSGGR